MATQQQQQPIISASDDQGKLKIATTTSADAIVSSAPVKVVSTSSADGVLLPVVTPTGDPKAMIEADGMNFAVPPPLDNKSDGGVVIGSDRSSTTAQAQAIKLPLPTASMLPAPKNAGTKNKKLGAAISATSAMYGMNTPILPHGAKGGMVPSTLDPIKAPTSKTTNKTSSRSPTGGPARLNKFVRRLHDMLQAEKDSGIVEWRKGLLVLHSTASFAKKILPKYFNTKNFKTFRRQLNYYGFVHVRSFSATGSTTTALWVNQELAKNGSSSISSVLQLKRVEPSDSARTAEGRRVRKEEAANTVEDIGVSTRTLQLEQIRSLALQKPDDNMGSPPALLSSIGGAGASSSSSSSHVPMTFHCHTPIMSATTYPSSRQDAHTTTTTTQSTDDAANLLLMLSKSIHT